MKNVFEYLVNTGVEQLNLIGDAEKKATICAELAKAIAQSGLLSPMIEVGELTPIQTCEPATEEPKKETKKTTKKNTKKDALKPGSDKLEAPQAPIEEEAVEAPQAPVMEEPVVEAQQEVEIVDEWTDEMCQLKEEQLGLLNSYVEAWGDEYVYNDCLGAFTENAFVGGENVRPSNIDGFVIYLQELNAQFSQQ